MLFQEIVYGPIRSRRLGNSLGINLMPLYEKVCNFNCVYCECGWTKTKVVDSLQLKVDRPILPIVEDFEQALNSQLSTLNSPLDTITFSGNGEPTMHPKFLEIMQITVRLRDKYAPEAKISVLSNSTCLSNPAVVEGLRLADNRILKLDAGKDATMRLIDQPLRKTLTVQEIVQNMAVFEGNFTLQTCFLTGEFEGQRIDNTTDEEIAAWLDCVKQMRPQQVMIYCIDRLTPCETLQKVAPERMQFIAAQVEALGIPVSISF